MPKGELGAEQPTMRLPLQQRHLSAGRPVTPRRGLERSFRCHISCCEQILDCSWRHWRGVSSELSELTYYPVTWTALSLYFRFSIVSSHCNVTKCLVIRSAASQPFYPWPVEIRYGFYNVLKCCFAKFNCFDGRNASVRALGSRSKSN